MSESLAATSNGSAPEFNGSSAQRRREWRLPALVTLGLVAAIFMLFWQTSASVVSIWIRSETFTHGFLILPISGWLIWRQRHDLLDITPAPNWFGIPILLVIGLGWFAAHSAGVLVVEQLAMMALVPTVVWTVLGTRLVRALLFPLFFLFFAIPMGEELVPPLMDFTANFTVHALQLTGIPVFREGTFFEIPSGRWTVVEACSGIRYLIASLTLGCLYAYLTFRSAWRRLLFVALAAIVPVFANGIRAYMIVMIAHLSGMRLALGVDHFVYGWVFFGIVMLLLFWIGSFWREDHAEPVRTRPRPLGNGDPIRVRPLLTAAAAALVSVGLWPILGAMAGEQAIPVARNLPVPAPRAGWGLSGDAFSAWRPHYVNADSVVDQNYQLGGRRVSLYLAYYVRQRQGAELINSQNMLITQQQREWRQSADVARRLTVDGNALEVRLAKLHGPHEDLLVWYWYWVDGRTTTNHYLAKLWDAKIKLLGGRGDAAAVVVATPYSDQALDADRALETFVKDMWPSIEGSLEQMGGD